jgi:hypothetical protein
MPPRGQCLLCLYHSLLQCLQKKNADLPTKKAKAADLSTKKAKAAGLPSKKAKAAGLPSRKTQASADAITKQILKYVHNITCGKVINIPVSEILKKQAFQQEKKERPL